MAWQLRVLGIAQDGGMPHIGCTRPPCSDARAGRRPAEKVACLGLLDDATKAAYLFDATPDLPAQVHDLTGGAPPTGIFLTHAHMGHYAGLLHLGKEAWGARGIPLHATPPMCQFLSAHAPWNLLVADGRVLLQPMALRAVELPGGIRVTPFAVPHRNEIADTVGFIIAGPRASAMFVPDADRWTDAERRIADTVDLALLDGTFGSADELPGRSTREVPHPLMGTTREHFRGARAKLWFIHLNHTNPAILSGDDVVREGMSFDL